MTEGIYQAPDTQVLLPMMISAVTHLGADRLSIGVALEQELERCWLSSRVNGRRPLALFIPRSR